MWRWIPVLTVAITSVISGAALGAKAEKAHKARETLAGTIDKVEVGAKSILVQPKVPKSAPAGDPVNIAVDEATKIKVDGVDAGISELKEGMVVKITPANGTAERIDAKTKAPKVGKNTKGGKNKKPAD